MTIGTKSVNDNGVAQNGNKRKAKHSHSKKNNMNHRRTNMKLICQGYIIVFINSTHPIGKISKVFEEKKNVVKYELQISCIELK